MGPIFWYYAIVPILAVVFGHLALTQTGRRDYGRGMAVAGLTLGYTTLGFFVFVVLRSYSIR